MVFQDWKEQSFQVFSGMYLAKTLKPGEQIIFGIKGIADSMSYAVLRAEKNNQTLTLCMDRAALVDYGLLIYSRINKADKLNIAGHMLGLNCIQCHVGQFSEQPLQSYMMRFDYMNDVPSDDVTVRRWRSGYLPDSDISDEEMHRLLIALETVFSYFGDGHGVQEALDALRNDGMIFCAQWTMGKDADGSKDELLEWKTEPLGDQVQIDYPSPLLENELQIRRIRKKAVSGAVLGCGVRRLPIPISENPVRTPVMLAMIDDINGVVGTAIAEDYNRDCFELVSSFMDYVENCGRPARILTADERTYGLLCGIAQQLSIPIERTDVLPQIDELLHAYLDMVCSGMLSEKAEAAKEPEEDKIIRNGHGICMSCGKELSAEEMKEHVIDCAQQEQKRPLEDNLILHISAADDADYWMDIALKKDATLAQLDKFLRDEWVDCCGHMSMFVCGGTEYYSDCAAEMGGRSMNTRIFKKMECGTQLLYDYDFGTTTRLVIDVIGEAGMSKRHKKVIQLARNIQPQYACVKCGEKAEFVISRTGESIAEAAYCETCADEVMQREGMKMLPILNSPRCGMCGYGSWLSDFFDEK